MSGLNPNPTIFNLYIPNPNPQKLGSDRVQPEIRVFIFCRVYGGGSDRVVGLGSGFGLFVQPYTTSLKIDDMASTDVANC